MKYHYYYIENFYNDAEILELQRLLDLIDNKDLVDEPAIGVKKTSHVKIYNHGQLWNELDKFRHMVYNINRLYFGFNLFETSKYSTVLYNEYREADQGEYSWHSDGCHNEPRDIKLTALLNISIESFEGGDFSFFLSQEEKIDHFKTKGSLLVFPSWTQHRVLPVTKGTRKTITCFFEGPTWK